MTDDPIPAMTRTLPDPFDVSFPVRQASLELAVAAALALAAASFVALSLGDPELLAAVAAAGVAVTLLALALYSLGPSDVDVRTPTVPPLT